MEIISTINDDNLGGNSSLRFAPVYFFSSFSPVTFYSGYDWINIECVPETILLTEKTVDDVNGGYQDTSITGQVPNIRPDVHALLNKYRLNKVIVECEDQNGNLRRAGTTGSLVLIDQSTTGTQVADANGYALAFTGKCLLPALFI